METQTFGARTNLAGESDPAAVDASLDGLRTRWNQFGVATLIAVTVAADPADGVVVRYRMAVDRHPDPQAVHDAFRGDLDLALARRSAPAAPVSWDLAAMALAAVDRDAPEAAQTPPRVYVDDAGSA